MIQSRKYISNASILWKTLKLLLANVEIVEKSRNHRDCDTRNWIRYLNKSHRLASALLDFSSVASIRLRISYLRSLAKWPATRCRTSREQRDFGGRLVGRPNKPQADTVSAMPNSFKRQISWSGCIERFAESSSSFLTAWLKTGPSEKYL